MKVLVTGSSGHLGEALMRLLPAHGHEPVGLDRTPSTYTRFLGEIGDRTLAARAMSEADAVLHTATLHKPHVGTHSKDAFVDTNIRGTLVLLEEALRLGISRFVYTSTTSAFGDALTPADGDPAAWIDEEARAVPKNIYGVTKSAAEDLCQLFARDHGLTCTVLRTSRFFPELDDRPQMRDAYADANAKANEFLYRRADLHDVAEAHILALSRTAGPAFRRYIISATTPFTHADLHDLRRDPSAVIARSHPRFPDIYDRLGYHMFPDIERVYVNTRACRELGWQPVYDFGKILQQLETGEPIGSDLARQVGIKGYHPNDGQGIYPFD